MDPQWSETGDRYLIKLFRDFVFHQVNDQNKPVVDMSHVLANLNKVKTIWTIYWDNNFWKLDVGVDEKMMLMSRDEQSCLIVSYKEVKQCIETAFKDLSK